MEIFLCERMFVIVTQSKNFCHQFGNSCNIKYDNICITVYIDNHSMDKKSTPQSVELAQITNDFIVNNSTKYIYLVNKESSEINSQTKYINEEWFHLSKSIYNVLI